MTSWYLPPAPEMRATSKQLARNLSRRLYHSLGKRRSEGAALPTRTKIHGGHNWILKGHYRLTRDPGASFGINLYITADWMLTPPVAVIEAHYLNKTINWHCSDKGLICYVHPIEWYEEHEKHLGYYQAKPELAIKRSAAWMLDAIDDLVYKHFVGWECNLKEWPDAWAGWKHCDEGIQQYFDEKGNSFS